MPTVWVPSQLQRFTDGKETISAEGTTLREVVDFLETTYPGLEEGLCEDGRIRPTLAAAVDGEITTVGMRQAVRPESEIHFLPALSGG